MNIEVKSRWVKALRSGKYTKGVNALRTGNEYCVLGVLCDLYDSTRWEEGGEHYSWRDESGDCFVFSLPFDVAEWAELERDPRVGFERLSYLNDITALSLAELADLIEELLY